MKTIKEWAIPFAVTVAIVFVVPIFRKFVPKAATPAAS
jgi:hypothetical protein